MADRRGDLELVLEEVSEEQPRFRQTYLIPIPFKKFGIFPILSNVVSEDFNWVQPPDGVIKSSQYTLDCLIGLSVYLVVSAVLIVICCIWLNDYLTITLATSSSNDWLFVFRFRMNTALSIISYQSGFGLNNFLVSTNVISLGNFVYFILQILMGFSFVNLVTLQYLRRSLFYSVLEEDSLHNPYVETYSRYFFYRGRNWELQYSSLKTNLLYSIFLYIFSVSFVLKSKHDMSLLCLPNSENLTLSFIEERLGTDMANVVRKLCLSPEIQKNGGHFEIDPLTVFCHNLLWTFCFYVGLQFTHLDFNKELHVFRLTEDGLNEFKWYHWVILGAMVTGSGALVVILLYLWFLSGWAVLTSYFLVIAVVGTVTGLLCYVFDKSIHVHHYLQGMCLVALLGHQNLLIVALNGLAFGLYIEGSCRWSLAPLVKMRREYLNDSLLSNFLVQKLSHML